MRAQRHLMLILAKTTLREKFKYKWKSDKNLIN